MSPMYIEFMKILYMADRPPAMMDEHKKIILLLHYMFKDLVMFSNCVVMGVLSLLENSKVRNLGNSFKLHLNILRLSGNS